MSATIAPVEPEYVRLNALVVRTDLNHRSRRTTARIQEYIRMLQSGRTPPPILVHRHTNIIIDGLHRYFAARQCQEETIGVVWVNEVPNPELEPELFAVETAEKNRFNGEPLDRRDVISLLYRVIKRHGKEIAKQHALRLNETAASFEEIYRSLIPTPAAPLLTTRKVLGETDDEPDSPHFATGEFVDPTTQDEPVDEPVDDKYQHGMQPISHLRSTRPAIMITCRNLRDAVTKAKGDFTDAERSEMEDTYRVLGLALNK